jgi:methionine-rich copper-binding protein CopC
MMSHALPIAAGVLLGLTATLAFGHTTLQSTSPANGAVLEQSPPVIEMTFRATANLTSVVVLEAGKEPRKLQFTPIGSATVFKIQDPQLARGRNQIQWKALSADGHVISGWLVLTVGVMPAKTN